MSTAANVDIAIIGGGIHGAAVAQAAAAGGYRCVVLEQNTQLAQGTSSRSSKLIHGGLRYLETGQFRLVRECLRERALLLQNAPDLVTLAPFHIPIYQDTHRSALSMRLGLSLYRLLGGGAFQVVSPRDWSTLDGLRQQGLRAVFRYYDAQTDDAALTHAVMASAQRLGAELLLATRFGSAQAMENGYRLRCSRDGEALEYQAGMVVNAGGPWANQILSRFTPIPKQLSMDLIAGTHIVIPGRLQQGMYYLEAPQDQRAVFVMPWQGHTLIGTTERHYVGDPATIEASAEEIDYLLAVYNHYFNTALQPVQIIDAFAGLRVLPKSSHHAFTRPRETVLYPDHEDHPHLYTIYGGKLTAHRATAERLLNTMAAYLPKRVAVADTTELKF